MKNAELRQKNIQELRSEHAKMVADLTAFSLLFAKGKEKSNHKLRKMRKDIARILTIINEKLFLTENL